MIRGLHQAQLIHILGFVNDPRNYMTVSPLARNWRNLCPQPIYYDWRWVNGKERIEPSENIQDRLFVTEGPVPKDFSVRVRLEGPMPHLRFGFCDTPHPETVLERQPFSNHDAADLGSNPCRVIEVRLVHALDQVPYDHLAYINGIRFGSRQALRLPDDLTGFYDQCTAFTLQGCFHGTTLHVTVNDIEIGFVPLGEFASWLHTMRYAFIYVSRDPGFEWISFIPQAIRLH